MEVTHVALDTHFSCGGVDSGCIWIWGNRRGFSGNGQNFVLYFLDPLRGLTSERLHPKGVMGRTRRKPDWLSAMILGFSRTQKTF